MVNVISVFKVYNNDSRTMQNGVVHVSFKLWTDSTQHYHNNPANIYLFKINNRNTRKRCQICSNLTIITLVLSFITLNMYLTASRATSIGKSLLLIALLFAHWLMELKNSFGIPKRKLKIRESELAFTVNNDGMNESDLMLLT